MGGHSMGGIPHHTGPPVAPRPPPPLPPRPGVPRGLPPGHTPKVKKVFCFKLDAMTVAEALATTLLIPLMFSIFLAHRWEPRGMSPPHPSGTPHRHLWAPPAPPDGGVPPPEGDPHRSFGPTTKSTKHGWATPPKINFVGPFDGVPHHIVAAPKNLRNVIPSTSRQFLLNERFQRNPSLPNRGR